MPAERLDGCLAGLVDAFALDDFEQGAQQDAQVEPEAQVVDVPDVEGELFFPTDGVTAVDLGPAGDAGPDGVAAHLFGGVELEVLHEQRPWADEAHLALEHVDQLGQLVEAGAAQEAAKAGQALRVGQQLAAGVARVGHGAEFEDVEGPAVASRPWLAEQDGPAQLQPQHEGDTGTERQDKDERYQNDDQVQDTFAKSQIHVGFPLTHAQYGGSGAGTRPTAR